MQPAPPPLRRLPVLQSQGGEDGEKAAPRPRHPSWIKAKLPAGQTFFEVRDLVHSQKLHTVCESASCPNIGECWSRRALTIMILGDICTRSCRFCDVATGRPLPVDEGEPERVARRRAQWARVGEIARRLRADGAARVVVLGDPSISP